MSAYMVDRTTNGGESMLNCGFVDRLPYCTSTNIAELSLSIDSDTIEVPGEVDYKPILTGRCS